MSKILESLFHGLVWLLRLVGLTKWPLPTPPDIPKPDIPATQPPSVGPMLFYGPFIPQWNSFDYRELATFDFRFQVHGCGAQAQKYGIKDPIKNGIQFALTIQNVNTGEFDTIFTYDGAIVSGLSVVADRLYWLPGWSKHTRPPYFLPKGNSPMGCTTTPTRPPVLGESTTAYQITLRVTAANGQSWKWSQAVAVNTGACT